MLYHEANATDIVNSLGLRPEIVGPKSFSIKDKYGTLVRYEAIFMEHVKGRNLMNKYG